VKEKKIMAEKASAKRRKRNQQLEESGLAKIISVNISEINERKASSNISINIDQRK